MQTISFLYTLGLKRIVQVLSLALALVFMVQTAFAASVPNASSAIARQLDRQLVERLGQGDSPAQGVSLCITTPVDVNNLELANPLARQVQEEMARWFVQSGYKVFEIRKGSEILFEPQKGETLLTRKESHLESKKVTSTAIVAGTYTVTPYHVRLNIRVVCTGSRETLAMANITIPIDREVATMLRNTGGGSGGGMGGTPIEPTVVTLLP